MAKIVALFTRAWIEIACVPLPRVLNRVALFTRAWIEIYFFGRILKVVLSRPLHEGVD